MTHSVGLVIDGYLLSESLRESTERGLQHVAEAIRNTVETSYRIYQEAVDGNLRVARSFVEGRCRLDPTRPVTMRIENQVTGATETKSMPGFVVEGFGDAPLNERPELADQITGLVGGTVTLFQVTEEGLVRISTSVKRRDGSRATGTFIPRESPVFETVSRGEVYRGRAFVVDDWYITAYAPIVDATSSLIGVIYVGIGQQHLESLRKAIGALHVGKTHYTAIYDLDGNAIIHPFWEGENVRRGANATASEAFAAYEHAITKLGRTSGRVDYDIVDVAGNTRHRLNYFQYVPEMRWIVVSGIDKDEIRAGFLKHVAMNAIIGLATLLVVGVIVLQVSATVSQPLRDLMHAVRRLSRREFDVEVPEGRCTEMRSLGEGIKTMALEVRQFTHELEAKVRDRTRDLERSNEELRDAKEKAEAGARVKSAFLASMSHEIRTPMNAVVGMTTLLSATELTREQEDYVDTIRTSGDALLAIINDILDYSKIESGRIELESVYFDLRECIEDAVDLVTHAVAKKGLEIAYRVGGRVPASYEGDVSRLRQILLNLLSNAVKFTERGEVVVEVTLAEPAADGAPLLRFEVRDTGIGIKPEQQGSLFKSFSQADASTTRKYGGTGLGLVISKRLAEAMGGSMWVESRWGEGSSFFFTARLRVAEPRRRTGGERAAIEIEGKTVLVVDDNRTNREILRGQLGLMGMRVVAAAGASEALELFAGGLEPDIALLDFHMPEMTGAEVARAIRERPRGTELPLVLMSSGNEAADPALFDGSVSKPIKVARLLAVLGEALGASSGGFVRAEGERTTFDPRFAERHPLRILMAEDNAVNQRVALRTFEKLGYRMDVAGNGDEAVTACLRVEYDLVLMDVQMPVLSGLDATSAIRAAAVPSSRAFITALSAGVLEEERAQALAAGMDAFLPKPIRLEDLYPVLEQAYERRVAVHGEPTAVQSARGIKPA